MVTDMPGFNMGAGDPNSVLMLEQLDISPTPKLNKNFCMGETS